MQSKDSGGAPCSSSATGGRKQDDKDALPEHISALQVPIEIGEVVQRHAEGLRRQNDQPDEEAAQGPRDRGGSRGCGLCRVGDILVVLEGYDDMTERHTHTAEDCRKGEGGKEIFAEADCAAQKAGGWVLL